MYQIAAAPRMSRPRDDEISERHISSSFIALQSSLLNELVTQATEPKSTLVIAEARSGNNGKPYVSEAGCVAVAMLNAEVHHVAND